MLERYEYKYLIEEPLIDRIRAVALSVGQRDPYAGPDGSYSIRSLYLDTPQKHLYFANAREAPDRFKARVRGYPNAPRAPIFLEIKRRTLDVIRKSRGAVSADVWRSICFGDVPAIRAVPEKSSGAVRAFVQKVLTYQLEPCMLVEYVREAYASEIDEYARLTIDRSVRGQRPNGWSLEADASQWRYVDHPVRTSTAAPVAVLELKFQVRPPRWMVAMVRNLDLVRRSFSKYGYAVDAEFTLPEQRTPRLEVGEAPKWRMLGARP